MKNSQPYPDSGDEGRKGKEIQKYKTKDDTQKILNKVDKKAFNSNSYYKNKSKININQKKLSVNKSRKRSKTQNKTKSKKGCLIKIFAIALILTSGGMAIAFAWLSLLFIFSPDEARIVGDLLPNWAKFEGTKTQPPETLGEIKKKLTAKGKILGKIIPLEKESENSFLLPIFQKRSNCEFDCKYITQLRTYKIAQTKIFDSNWQKKYFLTSKLDITGPLESLVTAPLVNATDLTQGSNIALPLDKIVKFSGETPTDGKWFYLQGKRSTGNYAIAYGYIVYYNPKRTYLQIMLSWTSPTGEIPEWKQVTGSKNKELVVNQTVGFEPDLRVYQVKPIKSVRNPIALKKIELKPPLFKDTAYKKALLIARSGLWTPAYKWLQFIQKQKGNKIPTKAKAQIDVIGLHAKLSQKQASISWASPSQQVQVDLINGDWSKALQVLDKSPDEVKEVASFLKTNNDNLWNRVIAALKVSPQRKAVQAWGGLILAAEQGESKAVSWLKSEAKVNQSNLKYIQGLLKKLKGEVKKPQITLNHPSRIIGKARLINQVNPKNWSLPALTPQLQINKNQAWYTITVSSFHNGKTWLSSSFNSIKSENVWNTLGLNTNPLIQITAWNRAGEQQTTTAIIKGFQKRGNQIRLLAQIEEKIFQPQQVPLALSSQAIEWVEPPRTTIIQIYQQNPVQGKKAASQIWRSLQKSNPNIPLPQLKTEEILQLIGNWSVQQIDLNNNQKPETIISISREVIANIHQSLNEQKPVSSNQKQSRPQSIIISDNGKVIYNDFYRNSQRSLTTIAKLPETERFLLIVEDSYRYQIKSWSIKSNLFQ